MIFWYTAPIGKRFGVIYHRLREWSGVFDSFEGGLRSVPALREGVRHTRDEVVRQSGCFFAHDCDLDVEQKGTSA